MAHSKMATKKTAKPKTSSRSMKAAAARVVAEVSEDTVTIDRRRTKERRDGEQSSAESTSPVPKLERRKKVSRRRQIDPTTCERDYTDQEVEFMNALDDYKRKSGRMFPTCSEVLEVIQSLGYVKLSTAELTAGTHGPAASAKPMPSILPALGGYDSAILSNADASA